VSGGAWRLEVYETEDGSQPFTTWVEKLSEAKSVSLDAVLQLVPSERGLDLAWTEWLKPLAEGLHEFRVRHDEDEIKRMDSYDRSTPLLTPRVYRFGGIMELAVNHQALWTSFNSGISRRAACPTRGPLWRIRAECSVRRPSSQGCSAASV